MEVTLEISRFDPNKDATPHSQTFKVNVEETNTVLDALLLAWQQDPSLSFRRSCRSSICGSCACRINGTPRLACQTLIRKATEDGSRIVLEPLPHFTQLKDLVVNLEPFFESLKATVPWLIVQEGYEGHMDPEVVRKLEGPATCILCGICEAPMDVTGKNDAAAWVKTMRLALDSRDALGKHRMQLLRVPREVLKLFIMGLPDRCPKGIKIWEEVIA
ncbi:MAG: succinate dehydrogenase/fumarate reductase iron-sulfur subunit [Desulfomonile tiedjei]|nr:succinate dehydrogenase/fumarate reductase iron-sulfur subunit [Desulfomonile tiedjei]